MNDPVDNGNTRPKCNFRLLIGEGVYAYAVAGWVLMDGS